MSVVCPRVLCRIPCEKCGYPPGEALYGWYDTEPEIKHRDEMVEVGRFTIRLIDGPTDNPILLTEGGKDAIFWVGSDRWSIVASLLSQLRGQLMLGDDDPNG